jgi:hypothetical protein
MYSRAATTYAKSQTMFGGKNTRECTPLHDKGRATFPGLEHPEGLEPRMLLDEKSSDRDDDEGGISDLLIRGLVNRLPKPDSTWSLDARAKWLRTAASIFGLVYRADVSERGEISIDLTSEQVAAEPRPVRLGMDAKDEPAPRKFPPL